MLPHIENLNDFIAIKYTGIGNLEKEFTLNVINRSKWRNIIKSIHDICAELSVKETIQQYIRSTGPFGIFAKIIQKEINHWDLQLMLVQQQ